MGAEAEIQFFSEYGHVANQIKENEACINMVANVLPSDPRPWTLGVDQKVKIQHFQNMVMLHIKLKGMSNAATCKRIFCPYTHPRPVGWGQRSIFFPESIQVAY